MLSPQCCVFHSTCKSSSLPLLQERLPYTAHLSKHDTQTWFSVKFHNLTSKLKSACRAEEPSIPPSIFLPSQLWSPRKILSSAQTKLETDSELGRQSSRKPIRPGLAQRPEKDRHQLLWQPFTSYSQKPAHLVTACSPCHCWLCKLQSCRLSKSGYPGICLSTAAGKNVIFRRRRPEEHWHRTPSAQKLKWSLRGLRYPFQFMCMKQFQVWVFCFP